ncbi:uncharacterized protein ACWYII_005481 isoform 2-T2 [Salvelinus alpinus]
MKSPKLKSQGKCKFLEEDDLSDVLCEFDAVIEDFTSPMEKRHFQYDEHLKTAKRRSSASVSDSGISDSENAEDHISANYAGVIEKTFSNELDGCLCKLCTLSLLNGARGQTQIPTQHPQQPQCPRFSVPGSRSPVPTPDPTPTHGFQSCTSTFSSLV